MVDQTTVPSQIELFRRSYSLNNSILGPLFVMNYNTVVASYWWAVTGEWAKHAGQTHSHSQYIDLCFTHNQFRLTSLLAQEVYCVNYKLTTNKCQYYERSFNIW